MVYDFANRHSSGFGVLLLFFASAQVCSILVASDKLLFLPLLNGVTLFAIYPFLFYFVFSLFPSWPKSFRGLFPLFYFYFRSAFDAFWIW